MRLRDFARFGQFVLDDGKIDEVSVVPDDWFAEATETHVTVWGELGYGYLWWTFGDGTFRAIGIHGQTIHIDPERQVVVVISSAWPEAESFVRQMATTSFLNVIAAAIDN
jgi:CubicO group peptidase (beta-lactamase class C family)